MNFKKSFLLLFILPFFAFTTHKYYLSLTQINYKSEAKAVQIITNVFMDDIETALNSEFKIDLRLATKKELKDNDVYFEKYLKEKLSFKINGVAQTYNYLGKEYEGDLVYFYLEISDVNSVKEIEVSNKILTKHFPTQENLIKSKVNGKHKSVLLTAENYSENLKY